jgi:hypothetical protein
LRLCVQRSRVEHSDIRLKLQETRESRVGVNNADNLKLGPGPDLSGDLFTKQRLMIAHQDSHASLLATLIEGRHRIILMD